MSLLDSAFNRNDPEAGKRLSAEWLRRLWSSAAANRIRSVVGGTLNRSPDGVDIIVSPVSFPGRAYVVYGTSATAVTTGAKCSLTTITYDHDEITQENMVFATVASSTVTFTKPGRYLLNYSAVLKLDLTGETDHVPAMVQATTVLRAGGTNLAGSNGAFGCPKVANFTDFVKNVGDIEQTVDISGATGRTDAFDIASYALNGGGPQNGPTDITFDVDDKQAVTLDTQAALDVTTSLTKIASYSTSGEVSGSASGSALIYAKLNSSGVLKIFVGLTEYAPEVDVYGDGGGSTVTNTATSLSITRLA